MTNGSLKRILILGAGTGGTIMANQLRRRFKPGTASITVIDRDDSHVYQPGLLFLPFGSYRPEQLKKSRKEFLPKGVEWVMREVEKVEPQSSRVVFRDGTALGYDLLIVATGSRIVPQETQGVTGQEWLKSIFDFYTLEGSQALGRFLDSWSGGKMLVHIKEMPIKCPVAPLEFAFLADAFFKKRKMRDRVQLTYVTPLSGAFTKPQATQVLGSMLKDRSIELVTDFEVERVDPTARKLIAFDGREVGYDVLVTVPTHMGDPVIARSGLGDELGFVPTQPQTLQSKAWPNIFVIGDASSLAVSKAGSVAHFEAEVVARNVERFLASKAPDAAFDGHANCFIEAGDGKAVLIDFSSTTEPLLGNFPLRGFGPFKLLRQTRLNHWGKLAFRWIYWHVLLRGRSIPLVPSKFSMAGKKGDARV